MVAAVPADKATDKTIYASIDGNGGRLTNEDGQIKTVKNGDNCTYTIAPDEGYKLYSVELNGKNITDKVKDQKLTLAYSDLANNNELEIQYISNEAALRYAEKNIVDPVKVIVSLDEQANFYTFDQTITFSSGMSVGAIIGIVIGVAAIVAVLVIVTIIIIKDRKQAQE